ERAIDRLDAAVARVGLMVRTGFLLDGLAPDHVSLHRDLHSSVRPSASRLPRPVLHGERVGVRGCLGKIERRKCAETPPHPDRIYDAIRPLPASGARSASV